MTQSIFSHLIEWRGKEFTIRGHLSQTNVGVPDLSADDWEYIGDNDGKRNVVQKGKWQAFASNAQRESSIPKVISTIGSNAPTVDWSVWQHHPRIVYSSNHMTRKRSLSSSSHIITLQQLIPNFEPLECALVTSFTPWSRAFLLDHIPKSAALTFVCEDDEEKELPQGVESKRSICLHPHHMQCICDFCSSPFPIGSTFYHCETCQTVDFCEECMPRARIGENVIRISMKPKHSNLEDHDPYSCLLTKRVQQSAETCDCERKRDLVWINPPNDPSRYSIFHAKLMMLQYQTHLRIVISSFNTDEFKQWDSMTDSFWICDFPYLPLENDSSLVKQHPFFEEILHFLDAVGAASWCAKLGEMRLDFSNLPATTYLITSIPSFVCDKISNNSKLNVDDKKSSRSLLTNVDDSCSPYNKSHSHGLESLSAILSQHQPPRGADSSPVFVGGFSIGGASNSWLSQFASSLGVDLGPSFRVVTDRTSNYFDMSLRLRQAGSLWRVGNEDDHMASHSKMICRSWQQENCSRLHGWVYVGSHNLSKASWGSAGKHNDLNLWEMGVISVSSCQENEDHKRPEDSKLSYCSCSFDLTQVPMLFSLSEVSPLSWNHSLKLVEFNEGATSTICCVVVVSSTLLNAGSVEVTVLTKHHPLLTSFTPSTAKDIVLSLSLVVWQNSTSLQDLPVQQTVLFVRANVKNRDILWVEGVFRLKDSELGITNHPNKYIPPHRRNGNSRPQSGKNRGRFQ